MHDPAVVLQAYVVVHVCMGWMTLALRHKYSFRSF